MTRTPPQRPARTARPQPSRRHGRGGTLLGIFIGLIIGLGMAAGVAFWLMRNNPAFQAQNAARDAAKDAPKAAKADVAEKPRFDFYKILPGNEEAKVQPERKAQDRSDRAVAGEAKASQSPKAAVEAAPPRPPEKVASVDPAPKAAKSGERFWLQAGSFAASRKRRT